MKPLREVLRETGVRPSRSLGQNFLHQKGVVDKIIRLAEAGRDDVVLEIGPGHGLLTEALARRARHVRAIEIDVRLCERLRNEMSAFPNVEIIRGDGLRFEAYLGDPVPTKLVSNLPYSIATPLILDILTREHPFSLLCLMVQREVAERMTAERGTKSYGFLSVTCQALSDPRLAWRVSADNFLPKPDVDSAVVVFRFPGAHACRIGDRFLFRRLVTAAFRHRRKTLANSLRRADPTLKLSEDVIAAMMAAAGAGPLTRAQELSIEQFGSLFLAYAQAAGGSK